MPRRILQRYPCGSIGQVGAWSLQGNKPISGGEGGVLATNDVGVFERVCLLGQVNRSFNIEGEAAEALQYTHLPPMGLGVKFRAHPLAIGIASVQLKSLMNLMQAVGLTYRRFRWIAGNSGRFAY